MQSCIILDQCLKADENGFTQIAIAINQSNLASIPPIEIDKRSIVMTGHASLFASPNVSQLTIYNTGSVQKNGRRNSTGKECAAV